MTYRCVHFTGDRATVVATPSWLARLFGAREEAVDLMRSGVCDNNGYEWRTAATGRRVNGREILHAIDCREVGTPSRFITRCEGKPWPG